MPSFMPLLTNSLVTSLATASYLSKTALKQTSADVYKTPS